MIPGSQRLRERLGPIGAWSFVYTTRTVAAVREAASRTESAGYRALWYPETGFTGEAFTQAAVLLGSTSRIAACTGIAVIWARDPTATANATRVLREAFDDRFLLGLGVSHSTTAKARGHSYERPLDAMKDYLERLDAVTDGERSPRVLAALAPRMLELARDRADGAHTYLVPPEHTAYARGQLGRDPFLAVEQAVVLETDMRAARSTARKHTQPYLQLGNYRANLRRLGYREEDLADGGSDALVDRLVAWGKPETIAARVREQLAAGADHVAIQPLSRDAVSALEWLAPALGLS